MKRAHLATLLQLGVSVTLLVVLVRRVPLDEVREALGRVQPRSLVLGLLLSLAAYIGRARRWALILARSGVPIAALESYRLTLLGTFYGLVTPGRVGEFARALHVRAPRSATLPSVVWDRVVDVILLELLCLPAFLLVPAWRGTLWIAYLALVAFTGVALWLLASPLAWRAATRLLPALVAPLQRWNDRSPGMLRSGMSRASVLWGVFFYALTYPAAWLLLRDLAPGASPLLLLGMPLLPLLGNLPVAIGGLGLREQVSAALFHQFGAGAASGAAFSLTWFCVVTLLPGVIGLLWSALSPRPPRPLPEAVA